MEFKKLGLHALPHFEQLWFLTLFNPNTIKNYDYLKFFVLNFGNSKSMIILCSVRTQLSNIQ